MNRQELIDTFVRELNGRGQAVGPEGKFLYVMENHPGCGIGCQPQFKKALAECPPPKGDTLELNIRGILFGEKMPFVLALKKEFVIEDSFDEEFLMGLQRLHDSDELWQGKFMAKEIIAGFCNRYDLSVPASDLYV